VSLSSSSSSRLNVALSIADKAFFMEKGAIRFHGLTAELLERPDLLALDLPRGCRDGRHDRIPGGICSRGRPASSRDERGRLVPTGRARDPRSHEAVAATTAVNDVSIALHEGEILGIIGPNGAGKTTLFDLISGFLAPDAGQVLLADTTSRSSTHNSAHSADWHVRSRTRGCSAR